MGVVDEQLCHDATPVEALLLLLCKVLLESRVVHERETLLKRVVCREQQVSQDSRKVRLV
jgi:mannitol/fructose-specific phosphotransferase system IIA component (Ntr-type)